MNKLIPMILILAVSAAGVPAASAAETFGRIDASDLAKKRVERERQFLYRAVEELNRSRGYVETTVRSLEKQIDAVDIVEPSRREKDISAFLEWYRSYADWLGNTIADLEADLSTAYSGEQGGVVRADRCYSIVDGYAKLGTQLEAQVAHLDKLNDTTLHRSALLRMALGYVASADFIEERNRDREKKHDESNQEHRKERKDKKDKDEMYDRYKNITESDIAMMQLELKNLDELQKHFAVLLAMGRMELSWISRKAGDFEALGQLARYVGRDAPDAIEEADNRMIKLYESDISYFKNKIDDIARARSRVAPAGSLKTLDRMEELSDNYDDMKGRYEHHITWLAEQTGAYRADIIVVRKER